MAVASLAQEDVEQLAAGMAAHGLLQAEETHAKLISHDLAYAIKMAPEVQAFLRRHTASGVLDERFEQLLDLRDDENLHFAAELLTLFFEDMEERFVKAGDWLKKCDLDGRVDPEAINIKQGALASADTVGAARLWTSLQHLRVCKNEENPTVLRCQDALSKAKEDYLEAKEVLKEYLKIEEAVMTRESAPVLSHKDSEVV